VDDMSQEVEDVLFEILKSTNFALQVDEWTDINKAELLAFARFENEGEIMEILFCCRELPETAKSRDIFNILSSCLECCGLSWNRCVGIYTDSAPSVMAQ
jgi:hypothetical protein